MVSILLNLRFWILDFGGGVGTLGDLRFWILEGWVGTLGWLRLEWSGG